MTCPHWPGFLSAMHLSPSPSFKEDLNGGAWALNLTRNGGSAE